MKITPRVTIAVTLDVVFLLSCQVSHLIQHILNENSVARGGIIYENVCHRPDELAVLDYR